MSGSLRRGAGPGDSDWLSVTDVTRMVQAALQSDPALQAASRRFVRGEVSNFRRHSSGHLYFTLKDSDASLRSVMFRSRAARLTFAPADGMAVLARGQIAVYERDGSYQLYVEEMLPFGAGALAAAFEALKQRLAAEGLFDAGRKRPLPRLPRTVGVVTSPTGAAIRDIISVAVRRFPGAQLVLRPALVQGPEAPADIVAALAEVTALPDVDVVIVGRGGGAAEELWAFNDERVARAIFGSRVPVVSAVGHETDFTIADYVADVRAPTPSAAAELVWPDRQELLEQIAGFGTRLDLALRGRLAHRQQQLQRLIASSALSRPLDAVRQHQLRLDEVTRQLQVAAEHDLAGRRLLWQGAVSSLQALSPLAVLSRGYSLTRREDGTSVRSWRHVARGDIINVRLHDGELRCEVQETRAAASVPDMGEEEKGA